MAQPLTLSHIEAERRLRETLRTVTERLWTELPGYDEEHVELWLARIVPMALAGQRASIALTEAYLSRYLEEPPKGVDAEAIMASLRNGTEPSETYRRPFVTVWAALKDGVPWKDAVAAGLARAQGAIATDAQLAMRGTLKAVAEA